MKKKIALLTLVIAMIFAITACGNTPEATPEEDTTAPNATDEEAPKSDATFVDGVLTTSLMIVEITEHKIIPVGDPGNEDGEAPVIAFWYNTTNLTDEALDPMTAWALTFTAIQNSETSEMSVLGIGRLPDSSFLESQMEQIKKDETVANAVAYYLADETTPVTLVAIENLMNEVGTMEFEIA